MLYGEKKGKLFMEVEIVNYTDYDAKTPAYNYIEWIDVVNNRYTKKYWSGQTIAEGGWEYEKHATPACIGAKQNKICKNCYYCSDCATAREKILGNNYYKELRKVIKAKKILGIAEIKRHITNRST